jgi:pimeloyl-ACP methyl ester carboxylesterase
VPTLVISGAADAGRPVVAAAIPNARLIVLAGLAHALPAQAPEVFAEMLLDFFK